VGGSLALAASIPMMANQIFQADFVAHENGCSNREIGFIPVVFERRYSMASEKYWGEVRVTDLRS
jgi:hypothetical protein